MAATLMWPSTAFATDYSSLGALAVESILWTFAVALFFLSRVRKSFWRTGFGRVAGPSACFFSVYLLVVGIRGGEVGFRFGNPIDATISSTYVLALVAYAFVALRLAIVVMTSDD